MGINEGYCNSCGAPATNRCSSCLAVYYCCKEHQKQDWKNHRSQCGIYVIRQDANLGRYMVARRDIRMGEIVLKEKPFVNGPSHSTGPVCLGCHNALKPGCFQACTACGWPLCSQQCAESQNHVPECMWAQSRRKDKVRITQFVNPHPTYSCILPLRLCYMSKNDIPTWGKVKDLESHCKERMADGKYEQDRFAVAKLLRRFYNLEQDFTEEDIIRICGIIQINGHEVPLSEPAYISLYWRCSLFEHSCTPNCSKTFSDDGEVIIRAAENIRSNDHLSISYTDPMWSTLNRRQHLRETKYFICQCPRCSDPTEMGTNFSAICCRSRSCGGFVLPESFTSEGLRENWKCRKCSEAYNFEEVISVLSGVAENMAALNKTSVESHIDFLDKVKGKVPDNHSHVTEVKLSLAQMIGQTTKRGMRDVEDHHLNLKENLCRELLKLSERIFIAEHRIRGVLYFELHAAVAEKARRLVENKPLSDPSVQTLILESGKYLEKVLYFLRYEPQALPEGRVYQQALKNMNDLKTLYQQFF